jgi:putative SOS response-associated peptidase YedK
VNIFKGNPKLLLIQVILKKIFCLMCTSYRIEKPISRLQEKLKARAVDFINWEPGKNAVPGDLMPVITNEFTEIIQFFQWGLVPSWAKDRAMGFHMKNTKMENLLDKTSLQAIFRYKRCVVPATGFSVWELPQKKQRKEFTAPEGTVFLMAGLWDVWGEGLQSFSIITSQMLKPAAWDMPFCIHPAETGKWLGKHPVSMDLFENLHPIFPNL